MKFIWLIIVGGMPSGLYGERDWSSQSSKIDGSNWLSPLCETYGMSGTLKYFIKKFWITKISIS